MKIWFSFIYPNSFLDRDYKPQYLISYFIILPVIFASFTCIFQQRNRFLGHQLVLWHLAWGCLLVEEVLDQGIIELSL